MRWAWECTVALQPGAPMLAVSLIALVLALVLHRRGHDDTVLW